MSPLRLLVIALLLSSAMPPLAMAQSAVVDVSNLANFDANTLNDALSNDSADVSALQNAINGNSVLENALSSNNVDVSDLVAADNNQNGTLVLYTNRQDN